MKYWFPRKRLILSVHRWLGVFSALFLVVLSITGLALNHTEELGLDDIEIRSKWILSRYGMVGGELLSSFKISDDYVVSQLGSSIFLNERQIVESDTIVGAHVEEFVMAIITCNELLLYTAVGELIEVMDTQQMPFDVFLGLGLSDSNSPVFVTDKGLFTIDSEWIKILPFDGSFTTNALSKVDLSDQQQEEILSSFQGANVSLYRVILDLHSGRLLGWSGRTLMDLSAVAILILVSSGIAGWLRKSRATMETKRK